MKLAIVGTGYVGLVSGACFAEFGYQTVCVDKDIRRIESLKSGKCPFMNLVWIIYCLSIYEIQNYYLFLTPSQSQ
tara:strand:+ start:467 stop:691 length:225 start_codon:yes stop_codon:yes gene_type:complete